MKLDPSTAQSLLDSIDSIATILDRQGFIVFANRQWEEFARQNKLAPQGADESGLKRIGTNYLEICKNSVGNSCANAMSAYRGIQSVLDGRTKKFALDYPCHSPSKQRWFRMVVTPIPQSRPRGVLVIHYDRTDEHLAAMNLDDQHERLYQLIDALGVYAKQMNKKSYLEPRALDSQTIGIGPDSRSSADQLTKVLSARERTVLDGLIRGQRMVDIASELGLSVKSIFTYRSRVFEKLKVENLAQLVTLISRI
jgi:DNA-binding CsgD family transcriptional regulator